MFSNTSIVKKLIYGFGLLLILIVALFSMSRFASNASERTLTALITNETSMIEHVGNARILFFEVRRLEGLLTTADDKVMFKDALQLQEKLQAELLAIKALAGAAHASAMAELNEQCTTLAQEYQQKLSTMSDKSAGRERMLAAVNVRKQPNS